jgi:hypothetical protein
MQLFQEAKKKVVHICSHRGIPANTAQENEGRIEYDYQVSQKVLVRNTGKLHSTAELP